MKSLVKQRAEPGIWMEDILITGVCLIGVMAAAVARRSSARHVLITDVNEYRIALAGKFGVNRYPT